MYKVRIYSNDGCTIVRNIKSLADAYIIARSKGFDFDIVNTKTNYVILSGWT